MLDELLALSPHIRYAAIYRNGELQSKQKADVEQASESESDRYEELLVNPTLLHLASQRGRIDCGGLNYLLVRYGNFFQYVLPITGGHVSVCIEPSFDVLQVVQIVNDLIESELSDNDRGW